MARIIQPPAPLVISPEEKVVYVATSNDSGESENWRHDLVARLEPLDVVLVNPHWPVAASLERYQAEWQRAGMEIADLIALFLTPPVDTSLDRVANTYSDKLVVYCVEGPRRSSEIEAARARFGVPLMTTLDEIVAYLWPRLV